MSHTGETSAESLKFTFLSSKACAHTEAYAGGMSFTDRLCGFIT